MGLAASQGLLLSLTARSNGLQYEAQQISQQRIANAQETSLVAKKYSEKMNNTLLYANTADGGHQVLTYDVITSQDPFTGLGLRIVDADGNIVTPNQLSAIKVTEAGEDGQPKVSSITSVSEFVAKYMTDITPERRSEFNNYSLEEITEYYQMHYPESEVSVEYVAGLNPDLKRDDEHYVFDDNCKNSEYLQKMLQSGEWHIERIKDPNDDEWETISWKGFAGISEEMDTSDDAAAQAEYEAETTRLAKEDKLLETELEAIKTELQSVEKQIDSLKETVKYNIEHSFNALT